MVLTNAPLVCSKHRTEYVFIRRIYKVCVCVYIYCCCGGMMCASMVFEARGALELLLSFVLAIYYVVRLYGSTGVAYRTLCTYIMMTNDQTPRRPRRFNNISNNQPNRSIVQYTKGFQTQLPRYSPHGGSNCMPACETHRILVFDFLLTMKCCCRLLALLTA